MYSSCRPAVTLMNRNGKAASLKPLAFEIVQSEEVMWYSRRGALRSSCKRPAAPNQLSPIAKPSRTLHMNPSLPWQPTKRPKLPLAPFFVLRYSLFIPRSMQERSCRNTGLLKPKGWRLRRHLLPIYRLKIELKKSGSSYGVLSNALLKPNVTPSDQTNICPMIHLLQVSSATRRSTIPK